MSYRFYVAIYEPQINNVLGGKTPAREWLDDFLVERVVWFGDLRYRSLVIFKSVPVMEEEVDDVFARLQLYKSKDLILGYVRTENVKE